MSRSVFYLCLLAALATTSFAQSGRKTAKNSPPATVSEPTSKPAVVSQSAASAAKVTSIIVGGEITHQYTYFRSSDLSSALNECVARLKERLVVNAVSAGKMTAEDAKRRAKSETDSYLLWLSFVSRDDGFGNMSIRYVDYELLLPRTAQRLTFGRSFPGKAGVVGTGGVLGIPTGRGRSSTLVEMKAAVREIAERLKHGGWF